MDSDAYMTPEQRYRFHAFVGDVLEAEALSAAGRPLPAALAQRLLGQPLNVQAALALALARHPDAVGYGPEPGPVER